MDLSNIHFTSIAGFTAIGAVIATSWRYITSFGRYVIGLFIGTAILKDDAGAAAMAYAINNSIKSPLGTRIFGGFESYVHPRRWYESVGYESLSPDPVLMKHDKRYALISVMGQQEIDKSSMGEASDRYRTVRIRYLRKFFNIEKFIIDSMEDYNSRKRQSKTLAEMSSKKKKYNLNRFKIIRFSGKGYQSEGQGGSNKSTPDAPCVAKTASSVDNLIMTGVYRLLKWKREDLQQQPEEGQSPFSGYPFPNEVKDAIQELEGWLSNEKWFRSKSIPWRRGWLLYGPPGTGKSTLVRALGMSFDLPVYIFDLAGMSNNDLVKYWDDMMSSTPCIALIEDIDAIFNGREYVGSTNPNIPHITFDCLLNCISGVKQSDGVFLTITTNHIEKLDAALGIPDSNGKSSRPGRIDRAICLGLMGIEQRIILANHILSDFPELINETVAAGEGETPAQFQSRCAQLALSKFWENESYKNTSEYVEVAHFEKTKYEKAMEQCQRGLDEFKNANGSISQDTTNKVYDEVVRKYKSD